MTDWTLCGHVWNMLTRSALAVAACGMLGCGRGTAETTRELDVSDAAGVTDNLLAVDASTANGTESDASVGDGYAWDGASGAAVVLLDSGQFAACLPPANASSDVCVVCEMLDITTAFAMGACNVEELFCGIGCGGCRCSSGTWTCSMGTCR